MPDEWDEFPPAEHPLDTYLGGKLAGQGSAFEDAGKTYGVDPTLLAAIATLESGHGTSRATKQYNNPTGMMDPKHPKEFQRFDSIPDAINATAKNLSKNYLEQGLSTIADIGAKYSPPDAKNDPYHTNEEWPSEVEQIYRKMGGTRDQFGPQLVGPGVNVMGGYNEPPSLAANEPPKTEKFWKEQLLNRPMPEDPNAPIQDYVYPMNDSPGTRDTMPNAFEQVPGFEAGKRGLAPAKGRPEVPGTSDAPNITFPEDPKIRI